jgi:hypothetical protein
VRTHEQYEELCAQVAVGRLSEAEWAELEEHLQTCAECRQAAGEFFRLGIDILPELSHLYGSGQVPSGMKERFSDYLHADHEAEEAFSEYLARAQAEGLPLGPEAPEHVAAGWRTAFKRPAILWAAWVASIVLAVLTTTIVLEQFRKRHERASQTRATPVVASTAPAALDAAATRPPVRDQALRDQLHSVEAQPAVASEELKQHQRELEITKREKADLISKIARLQESNKEAVNEARDIQAQRDAEIVQLKKDLERVRSEETVDRTASLVSESELRNLRNTVEEQKLQLDELRRLNAADQSARDLVGSRNLHVLDFPGWDENCKPQREFGRLLYAEGKKLEFYAFDLDDPRRPRVTNAFYLWAETPGSAKGKRSHVIPLGKFSFDNAKDNRWSLIVTDVRLLTGLHSIFVTAEPDGTTVKEPTGKIIFATALDRKANHP